MHDELGSHHNPTNIDISVLLKECWTPPDNLNPHQLAAAKTSGEEEKENSLIACSAILQFYLIKLTYTFSPPFKKNPKAQIWLEFFL